MKNKNRKIEFFKGYEDSWKYIKDIRNQIYLVLGIFFVFVLIGFFLPSPEGISKYILQYIEDLLKLTKNFGAGDMFWFILFNNFKSSFLGMILGTFFGVFPIWASLSNGYVLGFVASNVVAEEGASILFRLVPHGIFELPAIFISLGMGIKLGSCFFKKQKRYERFKENLKKSIKVFLLVVLPLLIVAAIIESLFMFFV